MEARHELLQVAVHSQMIVGTISKHEFVARSESRCWKVNDAEDGPGTNAHEPTRRHVKWGFQGFGGGLLGLLGLPAGWAGRWLGKRRGLSAA